MPRKKDKSATEEEISQFLQDVEVLHTAGGYTYVAIADRMGKKDSNVGNYRNRKHTITPGFLIIFYNCWREELQMLYKKRDDKYIPNDEESGLWKQEQDYAGKDYAEILISVLLKNNNALLESNQKLVTSTVKLAAANEKLVDAHILFMQQQGKNPDNGSSEKPPDEAAGE